ncbi:hypothetical protein SUNI508_01038 [Seiridium unicorne]|uniref:Uncharacterized protein n=1 Tax=Seiridium unicorne TaxID=138068 RepID=A0ABR2UXF5_9PEZI
MSSPAMPAAMQQLPRPLLIRDCWPPSAHDLRVKLPGDFQKPSASGAASSSGCCGSRRAVRNARAQFGPLKQGGSFAFGANQDSSGLMMRLWERWLVAFNDAIARNRGHSDHATAAHGVTQPVTGAPGSPDELLDSARTVLPTG